MDDFSVLHDAANAFVAKSGIDWPELRAVLAVKWFVSAVFLGKDPAQLTNPSSSDYKEFLRFSFANLYDGLTDEAKQVVHTLSIISRPVSRTELCLILNMVRPDLDQDRIDVALNLLFNSSVIRRAPVRSDVASEGAPQYCLTEFATQFVRQFETVGRDFGARIQKGINKLRVSSESAEREVRYYKYQGRAVRATSKDEHLVTGLIMQAIRETAHFRRCILRALGIILDGFRGGYRDWHLERTLANVCSEAIGGATALRDAAA